MIKRNSRKGFTIIELVIVIAVIVVLAAVLIPTFASIIDKANESADVQLVRQMNTILKAEETVDGKPANVDEVKAILTKNGIGDFVPALAEHAFAWDSVNNVVVLMNKETATGVFPKEYEGVAYDSATWVIFGGTINKTLSPDDSLAGALANTKIGETIVLSSDQTLEDITPIKNANIDLGGHKLTLKNGLPMEANANITLSNGDVDCSAQVTLANGANLTLNNVNFVSDSHRAFFPTTASRLDIIGGTIIAEVPIDTNYSDNTSRAVTVNMSGTTLGSAEKPCIIGVSLITSGDITITDSTIYATDRCVYNRAGNVYIENSTMNHDPVADFNPTYLPENSNSYTYTPKGARDFAWGSSYDGICAPVVVGDFHAQHYSFDANCTLVNVTFNKDNNTYPDVYLSQENYDVVPVVGGRPDTANLTSDNLKKAKEVVKTTLTCDSTVEWYVNPGDNSSFAEYAIGDLAIFANYAGFKFSNSGYGGVALMYVDNVFVNGVEQAPGSTSASPVPAN